MCRPRMTEDGRSMSKESKYVSLSICGYCGKDTDYKTEKVVLSGRANVLCQSCIAQLDDEVEIIAKKYLCKSPKPRENK